MTRRAIRLRVRDRSEILPAEEEQPARAEMRISRAAANVRTEKIPQEITDSRMEAGRM